MMALIGALIAVLTLDSTPASGPTDSNRLQGALSPPGLPSADFSLRDQDGRSLNIATLRGRPVIVTFLYTTCEDTCPVMTQQIRGALDKLDDDLPVVAVSVDPKRDTPTNARRFVLKESMTGRMRVLLGNRAELQPIWRAFGIRPQEDGIDHSSRVILLDKNGRPRVVWPASELTPEGLAHDLRTIESSQA